MSKITTLSDLNKIKKEFEGEIVELPPFDNGKPFCAKLKRLSLLGLCKSGAVPNQLLAAVQEIYEGKQRSNIKSYAEVLDIVCEQCLVEPAWDDIKDIITDVQKLAIMTYAQSGVAGLLPFRQILQLQTDDNSG